MKNLFVLGIAALLFTSCSKNDEINCLSGGGGNLLVKVIPEYNGTPIVSTSTSPVTVYVAFAVGQFPGKAPENYQRTLVGKNNNSYVNCHNLTCGIYYFYATYTDEQTGDFYTGQMPLSTEQQEGTLDLTIRMSKE